MPLGELTSRAAVIAAIAEFDRLGRDEFLARYTHDPARYFFLIHDGGLYDSKAIAGVAYGYQFPERGPLRRSDFSGGARTVAPRLRALGFEVVDIRDAVDPRGTARDPVSVNASADVASLRVWQSYTRENIHDIFSPDSPFVPQRGTWGLHGIVRIPERPNSYVFFVTFGQVQGDHTFEESITEDGVLTWQSQPRQRLEDTTIQCFIKHDERIDSIHLLLRPRSGVPYVYCGTLGYLSHDEDREQPVYFQWQLMDWPPPREVLATLDVKPTPGEPPPAPISPTTGGLTEVSPPRVTKRGGRHTERFAAGVPATHPDQGARNAELGLAGEELVLEMERQTLVVGGRRDLAERIVHVSVIEGDGAGYDIRSYDLDGTLKLIEVKTTRGAATAAFFISPNEIELSRARASQYVLMRLFNYVDAPKSASYYQVRGFVEAAFDLVPTEFRAALSPVPG